MQPEPARAPEPEHEPSGPAQSPAPRTPPPLGGPTISRWHLETPRPDSRRRLAAELGISSITAQILINRGLTDATVARSFCDARMNSLYEPSRLKDMDIAAARIHRAIERRERILIYGDYDVDGLSSCALLMRFFRIAKANAEVYIPNRLTEGYGMNLDALKRLIGRTEDRIGLVVTVDTGISAVEEADFLRASGIDLIVTDHHEAPDVLPEALAIVNPKQRECDYPEQVLSGAGIAYKLAWGVACAISGSPKVLPAYRQFLLSDGLVLAALGTVADAVPLTGENHVLAKFGLRRLSECRHLGLRDLLEEARVKPGKVSAGQVAFHIAPRLNAAGRTGDARPALDILMNDADAQTVQIARDLEQANRRRRAIETRILKDAVRRLENGGAAPRWSIVLGDAEWHPGVIGIVASRLAERYGRPVALVAFDGDTGLGRGSARTVGGFALHEALAACSEHVERHGGHAKAAGFSLRQERFEDFAGAFERVAAERLREEDLEHRLRVDAEMPLSALDEALVAEIEALEPFGVGNPKPCLAVMGARIAGRIQALGKTGKHLSFLVRQENTTLRCVAFGFGPRISELEALQNGDVDLLFEPQINDYRGRSVEMLLQDIRPSSQ